MPVIILVLATAILMLGSGFLLSTVGRRRPRPHAIANFCHELGGLRQAARTWLQQFDTLDVTERQLLDHLALGVEPVRTLAHDRSWTSVSIDRRDELALVQAQSHAAIACLRELEREIVSYRAGGYR